MATNRITVDTVDLTNSKSKTKNYNDTVDWKYGAYRRFVEMTKIAKIS